MSDMRSTRMADGGLVSVLRRATVSGSAGSVASTAALALAARLEGHGALQPVNATSRWLHGPGAAAARHADLSHTGVGYATHHAASLFWAALFEGWIGRGSPAPVAVLWRAMVVAAVAAAVDYGPTPRRFRPGWELVLSRRAMAAGYVALGLGMAGGALASRPEMPDGRRAGWPRRWWS